MSVQVEARTVEIPSEQTQKEAQIPDELIQRAQEGDEVAQAELWPLVKPIAESVARRFSHDPRTIEDIVGDGLARVYTLALQQRKYSPNTNFKGLVNTIVFHSAINRYRNQRRDKSIPMDVNTMWDVASADNTEQAALGGEGSEAIRLLMLEAGVNPNYVEPFILGNIEGYSIVEIAAMLGLKKGTVFSRMHRAKRDFRKKYPSKDLVPEL